MSTQKNVQMVREYFASVGRHGANFHPDALRHEARWNPEDFAVGVHVVSLRPQIVSITGLNFEFRIGDSIHPEISRKCDAESFARLAELGGSHVSDLWTDADLLFTVFGPVAAEPVQVG